MKRKVTLVLFVAMACAMTGCSGIHNPLQSIMEDQLLAQLDTTAETDYRAYQEMEGSNSLDESGLYDDLANAETPETVHEGNVPVVFAENAYLDINYYRDEACTEALDTENCYLDPGDKIYASEPKTVNPYSHFYVFSGFRVWQYHDGKREALDTKSDDANLVVVIPSDYTGTSILIQALGTYENRQISFTAGYEDAAGPHTLGGGTWTVNDTPYTGNTAAVSSVLPYTVNYDYSAYTDDYYFESSAPQCFDSDDVNGLVVFKQTEVQDANTGYAVQLHRYINVTLINKEYSGIIGGVGGAVSTLTQSANSLKSLTINGERKATKNEEKQTFAGLRCGDPILVRVGSDYKVSVSGLIASAPIQVSEGYEYALTVPQTVETDLSITVSKRTATLGGYEQKSIDNAVVMLAHADGRLVDGSEEVDDSERVTVTITPAEDYYITGKNVTNDIFQKTMPYKTYVSDIDNLLRDHPVKKYLHVSLLTEDDYGDCTYMTDQGVVSGEVTLRDGQKLMLDYTLTAPGFHIIHDANPVGLIKEIFTKEKATANIVVDESMDGSTIRRSDYITVVKK